MAFTAAAVPLMLLATNAVAVAAPFTFLDISVVASVCWAMVPDISNVNPCTLDMTEEMVLIASSAGGNRIRDKQDLRADLLGGRAGLHRQRFDRLRKIDSAGSF